MKHKKYHLHNFDASAYFNKIYHFKNSENFVLPTNVYKGDKWMIKELQTRKKTLNAVKEQLGEFDLEAWSLHTKKRDPSSSIIKAIRNKFQPELLTQAWCKFYECLSKIEELIPHTALEKELLRSVHLCEAPGGFISALNHFLVLHHPNVRFEWRATTLNPDYEGNPLNRMIPDDRLIRYTRDKWIFGADQTGDITKYYNHEYILKEVLKKGKPLLVTADGSVNCMDDPGDQERNVEYLHYCELMTALAILETGGTFLLKIFTIFEESTICKLYLLNCCFQEVTVFKPATSKSGNSEVYVICRQFKGYSHVAPIYEDLLQHYKSRQETSMFALADVNSSFLRQVYECTDFFMERQIRTINDNVKNFVNFVPNEAARVRAIHFEITNQFLNKYSLDAIMHKQKIVPFCNIQYNKPFQCSSSGIFKYFRNDSNVNVEVTYGRKVTKVWYSQYCPVEVLDSNFVRHVNETSLLGLVKRFYKTHYFVVDIGEIDTGLDNNELQQAIFTHIYRQNVTYTNVLLLNVPLLSKFLVGFLYILSWAFQDVYFFKGGAVFLKGLNKLKMAGLCKMLDEIERAFCKVQDFSNQNYETGILEVTGGEMSVHYLRAVWFYNNNLAVVKN